MDPKTLKITRKPPIYTIASIVICFIQFWLCFDLLTQYEPFNMTSLTSIVKNLNNICFASFTFFGSLSTILSKQPMAIVDIIGQISKRIKAIEKRDSKYTNYLWSCILLFVGIELSMIGAVIGLLWSTNNLTRWQNSLLHWIILPIQFTLCFKRLAMTHGFILVVRHFCDCLVQAIDLRLNARLLNGNRTVEDQLKMSKLINEIDEIYSDLGELLWLGSFLFKLPVTFLLFFCFFNMVSVSFFTFTKIHLMIGRESIIQLSVSVLSECSWALVFGIYVVVILKNLDRLSEQVSHSLLLQASSF
jgi:hypothetical protein